MMVKLNISLLKDIRDDIDFCFKLAKEESVILLPGDKIKKYFSFHIYMHSITSAFTHICINHLSTFNCLAKVFKFYVLFYVFDINIAQSESLISK